MHQIIIIIIIIIIITKEPSGTDGKCRME